MSLIHEALKAGSRPTVGSSDSSNPLRGRMGQSTSVQSPVGARKVPGWLGGVLAFLVVVVSGMGGYSLWLRWTAAGPMSELRPAAATFASTPIAVAAAIDQQAAPLQPQNQTVSSSAEQGLQVAVQPLQIHPVDAGLVSQPSSTKPVQAKSPRARPVKLAPLLSPAVDEPLTAQDHFSRFSEAMQAGDYTRAQQELSELSHLLPPQTLALLRAQAWYALAVEQADVALGHYQAVLERLPGDEEAGINMASIFSRRGQGEQARALLQTVVAQNPQSERLRRALDLFSQGRNSP